MAAFFNFVLLGINGPVGHVMPRTQNSGQAQVGRAFSVLIFLGDVAVKHLFLGAG
jgi:hypothetical protein